MTTALLVLAAAVATPLEPTHGTKINDDCSFDIAVGGVSWFVGGVGRIRVNNQWHDSPTLIATAHTTSRRWSGIDRMGSYSSTQCGWTVGDVQVETMVTVYDSLNATVCY